MLDACWNTIPVVRVFTGGLRRQGATIALALVVIALAFGCGRRQIGSAMESNTNWLMSCDEDADCGHRLACRCGVCTQDCGEDSCPAALECVTRGPEACGASTVPSCQSVCNRSAECGSLSSDATCNEGVCTLGDSGLSASALTSDGAGGGTSSGSAGGGSGGPSSGSFVPDSSVQVSAGDSHFCALSRGEVWCWGDNSVGQLGNLDVGPGPFKPVKVEGLFDIVQLESGRRHNCVLNVAGEAWCWGANDRLQVGASAPEFTCFAAGLLVGDPERTDIPCQPTPTRNYEGGGVIVALSPDARCVDLETDSPDSGHSVGCPADGVRFISGDAVDAGEICGIGSFGDIECSAPLPDHVTSWTDVEQVVTSGGTDYLTGCALRGAGRVTCWGSNFYGLRGVDATGLDVPETDADFTIASGVARLSATNSRICARMLDGTVQCWGNNDYSEAGAPRATSVRCRGGVCLSEPQRVEGLTDIIDVALGSGQSCASDASGKVWCWGPVSGSAPYGGVPVRFVGPWEDTSSECAVPNQAIHERVVDAIDASLTDCERDSDCVQVALSAPCYEACSPGPITREAADEVAAALGAASSELCDASIDVSTCGAEPECPISTDELRCVERICTRWHARPDCGHPCACRALDSIDFDLSLAQTCDGPDLAIVSTAPCPSCDESLVYVVVANTGGALFNGDVTITAAWSREELGELPAPFAQTLSLEPGETSRPFPLAFNPMAPPQGIRLTLDAPGDCDATNDSFAAYAEVPWCYGE